MIFKESETGWSPTTDGEKEAVWRQVDRLLSHSSFNRSQRYPSLLRYIVSRTLDGDTGSLKERIIGMEVFGRNPAYDSTQDPIVRVTAAELRKRLLHYYQDPAHEDELRLDVQPGSYLVHFRASGDIPSLPPVTSEEPVHSPPHENAIASVPLASASLHSGRRWLILGICGLVLVTTALIFRQIHRPDAFDAFWHPLLASKQPILICTADQQGTTLLDASHPVQPSLSTQATHFVSAETLAPVIELSGLLSSQGHLNKGQTEVRTTLSDLGNGPLILVGAFNNFWTLQFTQSLRFHFNNDSTFSQLWIEDAQDPNRRRWVLHAPVQESFEDYALVVRYRAPSTRQWTVIVGGLSAKGNTSALRFLLSRDLMADLGNAAPRGWQNDNLEIVLKTDVINGNAGRAQIQAIHTW